MRSRTFFYGRNQRREGAGLFAVFALSVMVLLFSGCAALGGGVSQMQENNEDEETSPSEQTTATESRTTQANEDTENSVEDSDAVRADDAEVTTGGGSVVVRAGDAEVTTGGGSAVARAGDVVAESGVADGNEGSNGAGGAEDNEAELRLVGDDGTSFSGVCVVGGESTTLEGEVPARLDYELNDAGLACDIGKTGPGNLRVVLSIGENQVVRETNAENAKISLVYRGGNIVASNSSNSSQSSSSSNSVVQQSSNVQSQSSNSSVQQSSSSINQSVSATD